MKKFLQYHVGSLVAWIVVLVIAFGLMPNTSALVRDQGATKVPSDMQSQVATAIQNKWGTAKTTRVKSPWCSATATTG